MNKGGTNNMKPFSKDMVKEMLGFKTNEAVNKLVREGKLKLEDKVVGQRVREITFESLKDYVKNNRRYIDKNPMLAVSLGFIDLGTEEEFSLTTPLSFNNYDLKHFKRGLKQIETSNRVENPEEGLYLLECRRHELGKQIAFLAEINNEISVLYKMMEKQIYQSQIEKIKSVIEVTEDEDGDEIAKADSNVLIKILDQMSCVEKRICENWLFDNYQRLYIDYGEQRFQNEERRLNHGNV